MLFPQPPTASIGKRASSPLPTINRTAKQISPSLTSRLSQRLWPHLPNLNFIHLHYLYFLLTSLISAIIFWGSSTPTRWISFTDSLFFTVSAMTEAGLNTINLSELNTFQQFLLLLLILMGSSIWVSAWVVGVRRRAFRGRLQAGKMYDSGKERRNEDLHEKRVQSGERRSVPKRKNQGVDLASPKASTGGSGQDAGSGGATMWHRRTNILNTGEIMEGNGSVGWASKGVDEEGQVVEEDEHAMPTGGWIGRNSQFRSLTVLEQERLSQTEYKAVVFLSWVVPIYFFLWQFLGCLSIGAVTAHYHSDVTRQNGLNPW
jgi:hypothetical protein